MIPLFPDDRERPEHARVRRLLKLLLGSDPVRRPMGLLDPRGVALAQAAYAAGREIPSSALYEDTEYGSPAKNGVAPAFGARPDQAAARIQFNSTVPPRPEHQRVQNLTKMLLGDGPVRRPMGLLDPRVVALAQAASAQGRDIPPRALYQNAFEGSPSGFGSRREAGETVTIEQPSLPPVGVAPRQPDPPDDPEFEAMPIPGTDEAIFMPKYTFRLVDPRTGKVLGGRWREGEGFRDVDRNRNKKPDSMEPGNVGGMNPNNLWILLERIW